MIKKIKRPYWDLTGLVDWQLKGSVFTKWFDENIEPINRALDEAVKVYAHKAFETDEEGNVYYWGKDPSVGDKYKALLINIEPIKKETAEDVLRDIVEDNYLNKRHDEIYKDLKKRAKAVLERESGE